MKSEKSLRNAEAIMVGGAAALLLLGYAISRLI
jgi:hypothetical protein